MGSSPSGGVKQRKGGENKPFSNFKWQYLEISKTVGDTAMDWIEHGVTSPPTQ